MDAPTEPVVFDFETRSLVDLKKTSAVVYAKHWSTDFWFAKYGWRDSDGIHTAGAGAMPEDLRQHVEAGGIVSVHNAGFEWAVWNLLCVPRYGWCPLPMEQITDTAARAARLSLPRALEKLAQALRLGVEKDMAGNRLIKQMAKPRKVTTDPEDDLFGSRNSLLDQEWTVSPDEKTVIQWWATDEKLQRAHAYGAQDVVTQRECERLLPELSASERKVWLATMRANHKGIKVDRQFVEVAEGVVKHRLEASNLQLRDVTRGEAKGYTDVQGIKRFISNQLGREQPSVDKAHVNALLEDPDVPEAVKTAARIRQESGKSSVAKLPALRHHCDAHSRIYDLLVYYGASTGRWSGQGVQIQNFPSRGGVNWATAEIYVNMLRSGTLTNSQAVEALELMEDDSAIATLSMCLRACIVANPGKIIVSADYSNIEGRVAAWYGGEAWKLQAFRDFDNGTGPDLYKVTAGLILGKHPDEVTKTERNVLGKVSELALGFQGGVGAYVSMGAVYGIDMADYAKDVKAGLDPEFWDAAMQAYEDRGKKSGMRKIAWVAAEAIKIAWRDRHPGIRQSWYDCEDAAISAIKSPGSVQHACDGKLSFTFRKWAGLPMLAMKLASGRLIFFPYARLKEKETPWGSMATGVVYKHVEQGQFRWSDTFGGDIFQSAVQGTARDIMAAGWLKVEDAGYDPMFSVHDELASEIDEGAEDLTEYEQLLCTLPGWAEGCPVSAAGYTAVRWRKD